MDAILNSPLAWADVGQQKEYQSLSSFSRLELLTFGFEATSGPLEEEGQSFSANTINADFLRRSSSGQTYWIAQTKTYKGPSHRSLRNRTEILSTLEKLRAQSVTPDRSKLEAGWLVRNRHRYAGEWIALHGDKLLANAHTAREVFEAIRGMLPKPLVMQVEDEEIPFAGW